MKLNFTKYALSILLSLSSFVLFAQNQDRFALIEERLKDMDRDVPGLKETVDFSVTGVSIQEFLRGVAESHNLNISVDPTLNIRITNNFTNEKVTQVIVFLCKEYDLDLTFVGTIMSFKKYTPPAQAAAIIPKKELTVSYNNYGENISWDFKKDTLDQVAKKITQLSKKNVLIGAGLETKQISSYVENMPFDGAIEKLAYTNQLKFSKTKDNYYILEKQEQETSGSGNNSVSHNNNSNFNTKANAGNLQIEIVTLDSNKRLINLDALNAPITDIIKAVSQEYKTNYFMFAEPKGNTTVRVTGVSYDLLLSLLLQGTDFTYKKQDNIYLIGDRIQEGLRAHKMLQLKHRSAETILEHIPAELKKGVDIKHFKELNGLICSGSEPRINEIETLVKQIDKVVPMILIEAIIVNISKNHTVKTGITAGIGDSAISTKGTVLGVNGLNMNVGGGTLNNVLDMLQVNNVFNLGKVTPNFYMNISALETNGNIHVQATPKLSTLNSHEASLKIGQTQYYELTTQNTIGSLTPSVVKTNQYNAIHADLVLTINPTVSVDDQVTLTIEVSNSDFLPNTLPGGPPPTTVSAFKSIIRVRNEDMIVLGGLEKYEKSETGGGIPILSRIPILKWFFSNKTKTKSKSRQIVFIKPTIIY